MTKLILTITITILFISREYISTFTRTVVASICIVTVLCTFSIINGAFILICTTKYNEVLIVIVCFKITTVQGYKIYMILYTCINTCNHNNNYYN